jgi:hypothetical protein
MPTVRFTVLFPRGRVAGSTFSVRPEAQKTMRTGFGVRWTVVLTEAQAEYHEVV